MRRILLILWLSTVSVVGAMAQIANGFCGGEGDGTNLTWVLDENGTLAISGSGDMDDYFFYSSNSDSRPWHEYSNTIKEIQVNDGVNSIGDCAFLGCTSLLNISLPRSIKHIGVRVFEGCSALTSIELPDGLTNIGYNTFKDCSALTTINIPTSVTSIEEAFDGCTSLPVVDNIRYADSYLIEMIDKAASTCTIKPETRFIASSAFENCENIKSVSLPNKLVTIGRAAFSGCSSLTTITFPSTLKSIEEEAFSSCI